MPTIGHKRQVRLTILMAILAVLGGALAHPLPRAHAAPASHGLYCPVAHKTNPAGACRCEWCGARIVSVAPAKPASSAGKKKAKRKPAHIAQTKQAPPAPPVRAVRTLNGHSSSVLSVAFSPDGRLLATGSADNTVILWDVSTGAKIKTPTGHRNWVESVAFSPDGRLLATGSADNTAILWDVSSLAR